MATPTDDEVEAGARALWADLADIPDADDWPDWDDAPDVERDECRQSTRAVVAAVRPLIRAQVLAERPTLCIPGDWDHLSAEDLERFKRRFEESLHAAFLHGTGGDSGPVGILAALDEEAQR